MAWEAEQANSETYISLTHVRTYIKNTKSKNCNKKYEQRFESTYTQFSHHLASFLAR